MIISYGFCNFYTVSLNYLENCWEMREKKLPIQADTNVVQLGVTKMFEKRI